MGVSSEIRHAQNQRYYTKHYDTIIEVKNKWVEKNRERHNATAKKYYQKIKIWRNIVKQFNKILIDGY